MAEFTVAGNTNQLHVDIIKLCLPIIELTDFRRANKCEVHWPEEQNHVLASELLKTDLLNSLLPPSLRCEGGRRASNSSLLLNRLDHRLLFCD